MEDAMVKILGVKPALFRPPYGSYNEANIEVLKKRGYRGLIMWDFDSGDTFFPPQEPEVIIAQYRDLINTYPQREWNISSISLTSA